MQKYFEEFISEIVKTSKLPPAKQKNLERELYSHLYDRKRELELQGYNEEKIIEKIKLSFGDTKLIAKELHMVNSGFTKIEKFFWLFVCMYLSGVLVFFIQGFSQCREVGVGVNECIPEITFVPLLFGGVVFVLSPIVIFIDYFSLFFLICILVIFCIFYSVTWFFRKYLGDARIRRNIVLLVFSSAIILNWVSVLFSLRALPQVQDNTIYDENTPYIPKPVEEAGFPLKTFYFPPSPMGSDEVPVYMWKNFYINLGFWFIISTILYCTFLKKYKNNKKIVTIFTLVAIALSLANLTWLLLQFD